MRVKGPNGLVLNFPDDVAKGLLRNPDGEFQEVKDEPKSEKKSTTRKSSSEK